MNKLLCFLALISISCYSTTSQFVNSDGGLNIPNIFGNNSPMNFFNGGASNIPIPNLLSNNNPIQLINGGGGVSNIPIPNIFGNNKPAQQMNGGGETNIPIPNIFGNNKPAQQINGGGESNIPISNIFGNNQPAQQINGGGGSNIHTPNVVINNNPASSLPSLNLPEADYQRLSSVLAEIQPLMNSVVQQLQHQRFENIPELNGQSGIIVALLLQMRAMLQNELQTLLCSGQTPIVISMEIQITTLLGQVNIALTLTAQQVPENSNQFLPVRSVLSLIEVGQINSVPSMLNYICSFFTKSQ